MLRFIADSIELQADHINLIDPAKEETLKVMLTDDGEDLIITDSLHNSYIVVDSNLLIGSLKVLIATAERKRSRERGDKYARDGVNIG